MQQITLKPLKHILVCTNERHDGRECCANVEGSEIYKELKEFVRENGLRSSVWITRTGCLGFCNNAGTTIVIYPDQIWLKEVKKDQISEIKRIILDSAH